MLPQSSNELVREIRRSRIKDYGLAEDETAPLEYYYHALSIGDATYELKTLTSISVKDCCIRRSRLPKTFLLRGRHTSFRLCQWLGCTTLVDQSV